MRVSLCLISGPTGASGAIRLFMQIDITFRGMAASVSAEMAARRWIDRLARVYAGITSCRVVVEIPHQHHERGKAFHIGIELAVPGQLLAVSHDPGNSAAHDDVYVAIADAFRAARRQLQHYTVLRRREVRRHEPRAS